MNRASRSRVSAGESALPASAISGRELEVMNLAARGLTNVSIAGELHLSPRTVQTHLRNIFTKLGVSSRTEAVVRAIGLGLVAVDDEARNDPD